MNQDDDVSTDATTNINCFRMVFRIRYNMSTMDYDPFKVTLRNEGRVRQAGFIGIRSARRRRAESSHFEH